MTLAVRTWRTNGTTIVACRLANETDEPRVALLESRVDGPTHVAPSYRCADATLSVPVPANATVGAGFATPAEPTEPVVELVEERARSSPTPDAVLADLSEPRPPHEAVVAGEARQRPDGEWRSDGEAQLEVEDRPRAEERPAGETRIKPEERLDEDAEAKRGATSGDDSLPVLDAVEDRIERLEGVAAATTVPAAADALATEGGLDSVRRLDAQVRADRDRLTALAVRALTLADRADAAEPRIETLERLS